MSKIEIGRYSALLRRTFGMKGTEMVAAELSPEISPTVQLEHADDPEWDFLKDVRNCAVTERISANAAGGGQMLLLNPPGSGVIAVIRTLIFAGTGTIQITARLLVNPAPLVNSSLTVALDTRWETTAVLTQSALTASFVNNAAIGTGVGTVYLNQTLASRPQTWNARIVLTPGFGLAFGAITVDQVVHASAYWHERQLPALEL